MIATRLWLALVTTITTLVSASTVPGAKLDPARSRVGINLSGIVDWNTEHPFVDVFRLSRAWISQQKGEQWGKGPALDLDKRGWPLDHSYPEQPTAILPGGYK